MDRSAYSVVAKGFLVFTMCALAACASQQAGENLTSSDLAGGWYRLTIKSAAPEVVAHADHAGCSEIQREKYHKGDKTQQWAIIPAGEDFHYLCSRKNGQCVTYKDLGFGLLSLRPARGADDQKVGLGTDKGYYGFTFKKDGQVLHQSRDLTSCSAKGAVKHRGSSAKDRDRQRFKLSKEATIYVPPIQDGKYQPGAIPLPPAPKGPKEENAPVSETDPVPIGEMQLPYVLVADPTYSTIEQQVRFGAVYYKFARTQNWVLRKYQNYDPGKHKFVWCRKRGMSKTSSNEMETTMGVKVMADLNVKYGKFTGDFKSEFEKRVRTKESQSTSVIDETSEVHEWDVEAKQAFSVAQWQLQDTYTLYGYDAHGEEREIKSWSVIDNRYEPHTTFPPDIVGVTGPPAGTLKEGALGGC